MTNLIATIVMCLVTNVVEVDNEWRCPKCHPVYSDGPWYTLEMHYPDSCAGRAPATEKTVTTTVKEIKSLVFAWNGRGYHIEQEKVISEKVEKWKKKEDWVKQ